MAPYVTSTMAAADADSTADDILCKTKELLYTKFWCSGGGGEQWDVGVLGAVVNEGMLAFWGHGQDPMEGGRGFSFLINY